MSDLYELQTEVEEWHFRGKERNEVEGRIIPFGEPALVIENGERFTEVFDPGSLTFMAQYVARRGNGSFVHLNLDHDESLGGRIGHMRSLEQREDGGWALFKLYEQRPDLPLIREMLAESHAGLSVKFRDRVPPREENGTRHRVQVVVEHVAATPLPTYAGAQIVALRSPEEPGLFAGTPALDEWTSWLAQRD